MSRTLLPRGTRARAAALLAAALASGCGAPASSGSSSGPSSAEAEAGTRGGAPAAGDSSELEAALEEARELLAAGAPEDALLAVDRALEIDGARPEALAIRARGLLALAEGLFARGAGGVHVEAAFTDALRAFEAAPPGPEASLGASRAALFLGRGEEALARAREAILALSAETAEPALFLSPERVWADAAFARYLAVRGTGPEPDPAASADELGALYLETEDALSRLLGRTPADPSAWKDLASLREWGRDLAGARLALEHALDRAPDDTGAIDRLRDVARREGGAEGALEALERAAGRHPDSTHARFTLGTARFDRALEALLAGELEASAELFRAAEADLAAARARDASYSEACLGWEVVCRAGRGWALVDRGEIEAAVAAFRSMEELFASGIRWRIEGSVASGVDGLARCADRLFDAGEVGRAADLFDECGAHEPADLRWAMAAGYLHREHAIEREREGRARCAAELADEANALYAEARAHMQASWTAYRRAVEIAPEDVRVVNDAALVPVYYLHADLDAAEALLQRCLELGEAQLADEGLSEQQRSELLNAWGDAHQNLGVLALCRDGDSVAARAWFERSLEIGPGARESVRDVWLARCAGSDADDEESLAARSWATPCE